MCARAYLYACFHREGKQSPCTKEKKHMGLISSRQRGRCCCGPRERGKNTVYFLGCMNMCVRYGWERLCVEKREENACAHTRETRLAHEGDCEHSYIRSGQACVYKIMRTSPNFSLTFVPACGIHGVGWNSYSIFISVRTHACMFW
jgi:hypothetical protein